MKYRHIIHLLIFVLLPAAISAADYTYTANNGAVTITKYNGAGGAVIIPSAIDGLPVTRIGAQAFINQTNLTSLTIPSSVNIISAYAFASCTSMTNATLGNSVTDIGDRAFWQCASLTTLAFGSQIAHIGNETFAACGSLTGIDLPESVTSIGISAFATCNSLTTVTLPASIVSIGRGSFAACSHLSAITVDPLNSSFKSVDGVLFNIAGTTLLQYPANKSNVSYDVPVGVTDIAANAFSGCDLLANVTIPYSVVVVGSSAFASCSSLVSVDIPNSVVSIGSFAFDSCKSLFSISIPNGVASIGDYAFAHCTGLTNVAVSETVTSIGYGSFIDCPSLSNIAVDTNNSLYMSEHGVLFDVAGTKLIRYPSNKPELSYQIPNTVTNIGANAFSQSTSLTNVFIPNSVRIIESSAFVDAACLIGITIPDSVTSLGTSAFRSCTGLRDVMAGNGIIEFDYMTFTYCSNLTRVNLGTNFMRIRDGKWVFAFCPSLRGVYFQGNAPYIGSSAFTGDTNVTAYYRPGTTGWDATIGGLPTAEWAIVADASATSPLVIAPNGKQAKVTLDGSRSTDPGGLALAHVWFEQNSLLATGMVTSVDMPLGVHPITLVVNNGLLAATNSVIVEVVTVNRAIEQLAGAVANNITHPQPFIATLNAALVSITRSNFTSAINQLHAFQKQIHAQLAPFDADLETSFFQQSQQILDALTGGNPARPHGRIISVNHRDHGHMTLTLSVDSGPIPHIEASTNMVDWQFIGSAARQADGTFIIEDTNAASFPSRFYRLVSP